MVNMSQLREYCTCL